MSSPGTTMSNHKPYAPTMAGLGGAPTRTLDDPICAVFIFLFVCTAATHMTILQVNLRREKKFLMSGLLFGFCMARITALSLRIGWSTHLQNISLAIAAQIFVALGVILLFIINLIFTQRIIRASHPHIGWHKTFSMAFKLYYVSIVMVIITLVTGTVQSFYTRDRNILRIDRDLTRFGGTYFAVAAFLPLPMLLLRFILPTRARVDKFGHGRFRTKIMMLIFSSSILTVGAAFRAGVSYMPRPVSNPAWYHSKTCFYLFNFTIEWTVVVLYAVIRVDKRFIIPNGAHGIGSYSGQSDRDAREKPAPTLFRILTEHEAFDDSDEAVPDRKSIDLEAQPNLDTVANSR